MINSAKRLKFLILLCSLLLWSGVESTQQLMCRKQNLNDNPSMEKGEKMLLCTFFLPFMLKLEYEITVDQEELLHGADLWKFFEGKNVDVLAQVGNTKKFSPQTPYIRDSGNFAYPVIVYTITLHKGIIIDVSQENFENICPDSKTEAQKIKLRYDLDLPYSIREKKKKGFYCHVKCNEDNFGNNGKCDLHILITWKGTDKNGDILLSNNNSLNTYVEYNKIKVFNVINNLYTQFESEEYSEDKIPKDIKARLSKN